MAQAPSPSLLWTGWRESRRRFGFLFTIGNSRL